MQDFAKPKRAGRPKGSKNKPKVFEPTDGPTSNVRIGGSEQPTKPVKTKSVAP